MFPSENTRADACQRDPNKALWLAWFETSSPPELIKPSENEAGRVCGGRGGSMGIECGRKNEAADSETASGVCVERVVAPGRSQKLAGYCVDHHEACGTR